MFKVCIVNQVLKSCILRGKSIYVAQKYLSVYYRVIITPKVLKRRVASLLVSGKLKGISGKELFKYLGEVFG